MSGFDGQPGADPGTAKAGLASRAGIFCTTNLEARVMGSIVGPVGRGELQYTAMWKTAQRMTKVDRVGQLPEPSIERKMPRHENKDGKATTTNA